MKIVINKCYGGFGLSKDALARYKNETGSNKAYYEIDRNDPTLISLVEELGEDSWGKFAELKVVEIPDDVEWEIEEYDGMEWISEKHRTWN
jgi:hypothetical protein